MELATAPDTVGAMELAAAPDAEEAKHLAAAPDPVSTRELGASPKPGVNSKKLGFINLGARELAAAPTSIYIKNKSVRIYLPLST